MRLLPEPLEAVLASGTRRPAFKILAYDPTRDKMSAIVNGTATQAPVDLTSLVNDLGWSPSQLSFTLADPDGSFNPDSGLYRKNLMDGAIIRLIEGDSRVGLEHWMATFTGLIRGNIGWQLSRASQTLSAKVVVYSRENVKGFKRRQIVSPEYTVGTDLGVAFHDVCKSVMGLGDGEIRIPRVLGAQFMHRTNQMVEMTPWDALGALLEVVSRVTFFDGDGRLTSYSKNLNRHADRILPDWVQVVDYQFPERAGDLINRVRVVFLDANLTKVSEPDQILGTAQVTTGFFTPKEVLECWWSDDRRQRAENTRMVIKKSAGPFVSEEYAQLDDYHGEITISVSVFAPMLALLFATEYIALAWVPDEVVVTIGAGITIPVGRAGQAQALVSLLLVMMCLGTGQYEIWGTPYDYAYLEKDSIAYVQGLEYYEENPMEIKNDFIGSHERAYAVAVCELTWQQSLGNPRRIVITNDPSLEIGDIIALPDGRKFCITNMSKTIRRGEVPLLNLDCFKVMRSA